MIFNTNNVYNIFKCLAEVKRSHIEERKKKMEQKRLEKKRRLKEMFDAEYDAAEAGEGTYFDSLKAEMEQQAQVKIQSQ